MKQWFQIIICLRYKSCTSFARFHPLNAHIIHSYRKEKLRFFWILTLDDYYYYFGIQTQKSPPIFFGRSIEKLCLKILKNSTFLSFSFQMNHQSPEKKITTFHHCMYKIFIFIIGIISNVFVCVAHLSDRLYSCVCEMKINCKFTLTF